MQSERNAWGEFHCMDIAAGRHPMNMGYGNAGATGVKKPRLAGQGSDTKIYELTIDLMEVTKAIQKQFS